MGQRNASLFHYRELSFRMPRFSMYIPFPADKTAVTPESCVAFDLGDKASKLCDWINFSFNIKFEKSAEEPLSAVFQSLRDDTTLTISLTKSNVKIHTNSMELAGDLVQDLADFAGATEIQSTASFPADMQELAQVVAKVDEHNATRLALAADSAELSGRVKDAIVRAEDCRLLGQLGQMRETYTRVMNLNQELMAEHQKRYNNQQALLGALKEVNHMIQKAARLRVGSSKTAVINACRDAVKSNQIALVLKIIQSGKA